MIPFRRVIQGYDKSSQIANFYKQGVVVPRKYYFILYNDSTHNDYLSHMKKSIERYGPEFKIFVFDKRMLDPLFVKKHDIILYWKKGGGYWLWKSKIIYDLLTEVNFNDIIFYCDLKFYFIDYVSILYKKHFEDENNELLVWKNKPGEPIFYMKNWCKMDVVVKYNMYQKVFVENCVDSWAGAMVIKKTNNTLKYIKEWLDMCTCYEDITDEPSRIKNRPEFKDHRHDQSLLSIVLHKYGIVMQNFEKGVLQNCRAPYSSENSTKHNRSSIE